MNIPDTVTVSVLDSVVAIDDAMRTIIQLLPSEDGSGHIVIRLDSEWNVEVSERGYVTGCGQTAVLQLAVENHIFILQV